MPVSALVFPLLLSSECCVEKTCSELQQHLRRIRWVVVFVFVLARAFWERVLLEVKWIEVFAFGVVHSARTW